MTESEWMSSDDSILMMQHLDHQNSSWIRSRQARLFFAACYRQIWKNLGFAARRAVEVAEFYADGKASFKELLKAAITAGDSITEADAPGFYLAEKEPYFLRTIPSTCCGLGGTGRGQADALRDIVGNPFRPAVFDSAWLTPLVLSLAQSAYDNRLPTGQLDQETLAVLSDALEDAGCPSGNPVLLAMRSPGPHWRGCWAVDLLLGKDPALPGGRARRKR